MRIFPIAALLFAFALPGAEIDPEAAQLRTQIEDVERSIDRRLSQIRTDSQPMMQLGSTRGAYLNGYGAVFTVELNLYPAASLNPFRQSYSEEEKRQLNIRKRQRLETLEAEAREILIDEAPKLLNLPEGEKVALAVSLFHFGWEDLTGLPRQMVAAATRPALYALREDPIEAVREGYRIELRYF